MYHFCFLTGSYGRQDPLMFERQGKSLVEAGFKVTYIVCDDLPNEKVDGIEFVSTNFVPKGRFEQFLHTSKHIIRVAKVINADVYQISDPEMIASVKALKKMGKAVVFNMREDYSELLMRKHYIPKFLRKTAVRVYDAMMRRFLKLYDAVFSVTDSIVNKLKEQFHLDNCYLLTNFPRVRNDYNFDFDDYLKRGDVLCYTGYIYKRSRQKKVFEALMDLHSVHYILAGKIEENNESIIQHPYWKQVEFIDGFNKEQQYEILKKSTIANVFRDFGKGNDGSWGVIKIFEAMEAALPVLITDVPLYRGIIEKYQCGICVNPNDVNSIKNAIKFLITNKKEAYMMGQRGRKAVIEEYNWDKQAEKYIQVINQIIAIR